ncbi:MAG TPA: hypothetical protein VMP67_10860 [Candidatus Limnocylindria bacterium]|nr:hypothetical protein [Candidatus Limnocylindria bacterium]
MELEQDMRVTSDDLMHRLDRLRELEIEKRQLTPGSARFRKLDRDIERLAAGVLTKSAEQEQLGRQAGAMLEQTGVASPPIADIAPRRELYVILGEWREAERALAAAAPGTPAQQDAQAAVQRLRDEYRESYSDASHDTAENSVRS